MQVSIETLEGLQRKMTVQVPDDKISSAIDQKLKHLSKTVKLDGFRPGKVPVSVVKQKFGAQVRNEVIGDVIESSYREAIMQENLRPAGMPNIEPLDQNADEGMAYSATFEVYPEIDTIEVSSIELEKPVTEIAEGDIDNMVNKLREQRRQWNEVERAAEQGDQVQVDFDGSIDGEAFAGGSGKDMQVEIGAGRMLKEFEDGLLGMSKDEEKTVDVSFPEDYHGKEVAGKTAQFVLKVSKVSEPVLPELDADLIKSFGIESGDPADFRTNVKQNMEKELAQKIKSNIKNLVMAGLLEKNEVETPQALVSDEIGNLKAQTAQNMGQDPSKMDLNNFPDELFKEEAEKRVKLGLLIGELIRKEDIKLDSAKFNESLMELASSYEQPQQVVDYYTNNRDARASLEGMVLEDQVVEHILENAKVTDKEVPFEEIMQA